MNEFLVFLLVSVFLGLMIFLISYSLSSSTFCLENLSMYECGFEPFGDSSNVFDLHFYIMCILFMIFDLEILYIFPWSLVLFEMDFFGFFSMGTFVLVLLLGFLYEWKKKVLIWVN